MFSLDQACNELLVLFLVRSACIVYVRGRIDQSVSLVPSGEVVITQRLVIGDNLRVERFAIERPAECSALSVLDDVLVLGKIVAVVQRSAVLCHEETLIGTPAVVQGALCCLTSKTGTLGMVGGHADIASRPHVGDGALVQLTTHDTSADWPRGVVDNGRIHKTHVPDGCTLRAAEEPSLVVVVNLNVKVPDDMILAVEGSSEVQVVGTKARVPVLAHRWEVGDVTHVKVIHQTDVDGVAPLVHETAHPAQFLRSGDLVPLVDGGLHFVAFEAAVLAVPLLVVLVWRYRTSVVRIAVGHRPCR